MLQFVIPDEWFDRIADAQGGVVELVNGQGESISVHITDRSRKRAEPSRRIGIGRELIHLPADYNAAFLEMDAEIERMFDRETVF